jgi:mono/diheme cytochrome c family protein
MQQNQNKPAQGDRTHRERHGAQGAKQMQTNTTNLDPGPTRPTGTAMLMGILAALLVLPVVAAEQDDEAVEFEWTRAMLDIIEAGDAERGAELAQKSKCSKCHGDAGIAEDDETPSIAGQVPAYHFKQPCLSGCLPPPSGIACADAKRCLTRLDDAEVPSRLPAHFPERSCLSRLSLRAPLFQRLRVPSLWRHWRALSL